MAFALIVERNTDMEKETTGDAPILKRFYRVCKPETEQGLWYNFDGSFSGLIHDRFAFCENSKLEMDFDPELVGWLSAVENMTDLYKWFTIQDILKLQEEGWYVHEYLTTSYKFYDRFQHYVICQRTSEIVGKIILEPIRE